MLDRAQDDRTGVERARNRPRFGTRACTEIIQPSQHERRRKAGALEQREVLVLRRGADDALYPQARIRKAVAGERTAERDVRDLEASARLQHPVDLGKRRTLVGAEL